MIWPLILGQLLSSMTILSHCIKLRQSFPTLSKCSKASHNFTPLVHNIETLLLISSMSLLVSLLAVVVSFYLSLQLRDPPKLKYEMSREPKRQMERSDCKIMQD